MIYFTSTNLHSSLSNQDDVEYISITEVLQRLKNKDTLALDIETTSLNPRDGDIIMLQLGDGEHQYVIDARDTDLSKLSDLFDDTKVFIGHNIKFDYNFLKHQGILLHNVYDTMIVDQVIYCGKYSMDQIIKLKRFSLAGVYNHYFGISINKNIRQDFSSIGDRAFPYDHILYGAKDVVYPFQIKEKQENLLDTYNVRKCADLENKALLSVADIEYNGIYIDKLKWLDISRQTKLKLVDTELELDDLLLSEPNGEGFKKVATQLDLFTGERSDERRTIVNWSSDQQVLKVLNNTFSIFPQDKHGKASSGADAIKILPKETEITKKLLQYREESKIIDSFGRKFIDKYHEKDDRIHTSYQQVISTGRMSSRNPNMQQIPRFGGFRESFKAPEGKLLCTADYSSQEGRVMADMSNDKTYIDFFLNGDGDIHSFVGRTLFSAARGKPIDIVNDKSHPNYELRYQAKILNFMISYGGSAYTLSKTLKVSEKEAQTLINAFYKGFPQLKEFFDKSKKEGINNGYIRINNVTNRLRWFGNWKKYNELINSRVVNRETRSEIMKIKGSIERRSQNTKIQGTSGDMTKTALILLRKELIKNNILPYTNAKVKIVNVIHDEIVIEADKDIIEEWSIILKESMEKAASYYCNSLTVPTEPVISETWTH